MEQRLQQAKDNVTKMNSIMETWAESPLFVRKVETKVLGLLSLNDRKDRVKSRYEMITKNGEEIHQLIEQNAGFFKVKTDFPKIVILRIIRRKRLSEISVSPYIFTMNFVKANYI